MGREGEGRRGEGEFHLQTVGETQRPVGCHLFIARGASERFHV